MSSAVTSNHARRRVLLVEAKDMPKWEGGAVLHEVHVLPIGLMCLASAIRSQGAHDVRIVESSLDCPTDAAFVRELEDFQPDIVGIRSIVFFVEELQRLARLTRAHSRAPGSPGPQSVEIKSGDDGGKKADGNALFSRRPPACRDQRI